VSGIENIPDPRRKAAGSRPFTLIDFLNRRFSPLSTNRTRPIRRLQGMSTATGARKETLLNTVFRIPCALDNRPLRFNEFESLTDSSFFAFRHSADYELAKSGGVIVEQVIRPPAS